MPAIAIPATETQPWPDPPASGNWVRLPDGALAPADEATARGAGLWQDEPAAPNPAPEA